MALTKNILFLFFIISITITITIPAKLNIVTSITDIADIAKNVGGDSVAVYSLAQGSEDMHKVRVRSSFLPKIKRADFVMSLGLFAESFWLKPLVSSARNDYVKQ